MEVLHVPPWPNTVVNLMVRSNYPVNIAGYPGCKNYHVNPTDKDFWETGIIIIPSAREHVEANHSHVQHVANWWTRGCPVFHLITAYSFPPLLLGFILVV
jgi:hypothetical protein